MFRAFESDEHRPFLMEAGRPAALLVHGFPGTPAEMRPLAHLLHGQGWTVSGVLLPGFGPELEALDRYGAEDWRLTVELALAELARDHAPLLLAGNSMGGALAAWAASRCHVDGLVLLNPFTSLNHILWRALPVLKYVLHDFHPFTLVKLDFDDPETRAGVAKFMPGVDLDDPAVQREIRSLTLPTNLLDQIRRVGQAANDSAPALAVPVLVLQGTRDELTQPATTRQLVGRLSGAVTYREVDAEHNLLDPALPAWPAVEAAVLAFAGSLTGAGLEDALHK